MSRSEIPKCEDVFDAVVFLDRLADWYRAQGEWGYERDLAEMGRRLRENVVLRLDSKTEPR